MTHISPRNKKKNDSNIGRITVLAIFFYYLLQMLQTEIAQPDRIPRSFHLRETRNSSRATRNHCSSNLLQKFR